MEAWKKLVCTNPASLTQQLNRRAPYARFHPPTLLDTSHPTCTQSLVGFFALLKPGSIIQVFCAFLFSAFFFFLVSITKPYKEDSDDYFAKACGFALTTLFFFVVVRVNRLRTPTLIS